MWLLISQEFKKLIDFLRDDTLLEFTTTSPWYANLMNFMVVDGLIRHVLTVNSGMKTMHKGGINGSIGLKTNEFHKCWFEIVCK